MAGRAPQTTGGYPPQYGAPPPYAVAAPYGAPPQYGAPPAYGARPTGPPMQGMGYGVQPSYPQGAGMMQAGVPPYGAYPMQQGGFAPPAYGVPNAAYGMQQPPLAPQPEPTVSARTNPLNDIWGKKPAIAPTHSTHSYHARAPAPAPAPTSAPAPPRPAGPRNYDIFRDMMDPEPEDFGGFVSADQTPVIATNGGKVDESMFFSSDLSYKPASSSSQAAHSQPSMPTQPAVGQTIPQPTPQYSQSTQPPSFTSVQPSNQYMPSTPQLNPTIQPQTQFGSSTQPHPAPQYGGLPPTYQSGSTQQHQQPFVPQSQPNQSQYAVNPQYPIANQNPGPAPSLPPQSQQQLPGSTQSQPSQPHFSALPPQFAQPQLPVQTQPSLSAQPPAYLQPTTSAQSPSIFGAQSTSAAPTQPLNSFQPTMPMQAALQSQPTFGPSSTPVQFEAFASQPSNTSSSIPTLSTKPVDSNQFSPAFSLQPQTSAPTTFAPALLQPERPADPYAELFSMIEADAAEKTTSVASTQEAEPKEPSTTIVQQAQPQQYQPPQSPQRSHEDSDDEFGDFQSTNSSTSVSVQPLNSTGLSPSVPTTLPFTTSSQAPAISPALPSTQPFTFSSVVPSFAAPSSTTPSMTQETTSNTELFSSISSTTLLPDNRPSPVLASTSAGAVEFAFAGLQSNESIFSSASLPNIPSTLPPLSTPLFQSTTSSLPTSPPKSNETFSASMFDSEVIREAKPMEPASFQSGDRFSALSALSTLSSPELFSKSEPQELQPIQPVAPNSAPLTFDAVSMDQNDDDDGFGAFETSTSVAPTALIAPFTANGPPASDEIVFAAPKNLSISGMLEEFEASGEPARKPPKAVVPAAPVSLEFPKPTITPKKIDWSSVDASDIFEVAPVSDAPKPALLEVAPVQPSLPKATLPTPLSSLIAPITPVTPVSTVTPIASSAPSFFAFDDEPVSQKRPIEQTSVKTAGNSQLPVLSDDDFMFIDSNRTSSPAPIPVASNTSPSVIDDFFGMFGSKPKAQPTPAPAPTPAPVPTPQVKAPATKQAPAVTPTVKNPAPSAAKQSTQNQPNQNSPLVQQLNALINQERIGEALECRKFLQSNQNPSNDHWNRWKGPAGANHLSFSVMYSKLNAKGADKAAAFYARFKEPLVSIARRDLDEALRVQAQALDFYRTTMSGKPSISMDQLNTWQRTLDFCLAEIEIAEQFVKSTLSKAKAFPQPQNLLDRVFQSQKAKNYFLGLAEVHNVACRIRMALQLHRESLQFAANVVPQLFGSIDQISNTWTNIFAQLKGVNVKMPGERRGDNPITASSDKQQQQYCTLCLLPGQVNDNTNPTLLWNNNFYHASCANFYCNRSINTA